METEAQVVASGNTTDKSKPVRPLVLVVDDDRDARIIYREYLRRMGCRVVTARDGNEAILKAERWLPDVIVMDLAMPRMDGWTATKYLRRNALTRRVPIIALTAAPSARDSARKAGCDAFLAKPCLPELLWWEVCALLYEGPEARQRWAKAGQRSGAVESPVTTPPGTLPRETR